MKNEQNLTKIQKTTKKVIFTNLILLSLNLIFCFLIFTSDVGASDYVLPYPSFMPGNKLYQIRLLWEKLAEYWSFGNFSHFKYYLTTSDKYLVEAKTLFEYHQYKLALEALEKSDVNFNKAGLSLISALSDDKTIDKQLNIFQSAGEKHQEIISQLIKDQPEKITWKEEKKADIVLEIRYFLNLANKQRESVVKILQRKK